MINPNTVDSPRDRWTLIDILCQHGGEDGNNWWALALGRWDGVPCLAARWNGADNAESKGNPISRGYPIWFILPDEIANTMKSLIPPVKRNLVDSILSDTPKSRF